MQLYKYITKLQEIKPTVFHVNEINTFSHLQTYQMLIDQLHWS